MTPNFAQVLELLEPAFQRLIQMPPGNAGKMPRNMPTQGVYLFSEGSQHLYVGRSDNIRRRIGLHCRPGSQHNQATFAFRMARHKTGCIAATYTVSGSRSEMVKDAVFGSMFAECKVAFGHWISVLLNRAIQLGKRFLRFTQQRY